MSYLCYLCSFACCGVQHILCCVVFICFCFVFCCCFVCLRLLSCVWCCRTHIIVFFAFVLCMVVANTYCVVFICYVCLRLVCIMLPVSLDCPFVISPLVFSNVYLNRNVNFGSMLSNTVIKTLFYIIYLTFMCNGK